MGKVADPNLIATSNTSTQRLKELIKSVGWTVPMNGDAVGGFSNTVDLFTAAAVWNPTRAWQIWREPGGKREWSLQRGTPAGYYRVKYSASTRFINGSPSSTVTPAASDEIVLCGSGTDASPGYAQLFAADNSYRMHAIAWSTPVNGVYPFYLYAVATPGGTAAPGFIMQEPMALGTFDSSDEDPCAVCASAGACIPSSVFAWLGYNTPGQVAQACTVNLGPWPANLATEFRTNKDPIQRITYSAANAGTRIKGQGNHVLVKGLARAWPHTIQRTTDALVYAPTTVVTLLPFADNTEPQM